MATDIATQFAKTVRSSDGRQVLFFVEPDGGNYFLHQITNHEGFQADYKVEFATTDAAVNEKRAFEALVKVDVMHADLVIRAITEMFAERPELLTPKTT